MSRIHRPKKSRSKADTDLPLTERHASQIIRRKMMTKVKPSAKIYSRKRRRPNGA